MITPDRTELARFVSALFCRADMNTFVAMRAFYDRKDGFALYDEWRTIRITGDDQDIVDAAEDLATLAALDDEAIVFATPVATFINREKAEEASLANGLVISAELDGNPADGRQRLATILGPGTVVMESGGLWIDPATGELIPKLHAHWRLAAPTRTKIEHDFLKEANKLATMLAGGDPSAVPLVHPLRWPGSWHRKAEPRLAQIVDYNPAAEVTSMPAGGKRPGAGRKPSAITAAAKQRIRFRSRELVDQAAREGVMPLQIQLEYMRHVWAKAHRGPEPDLELMKEAAAAAAAVSPYVHPRLSAMTARVENVTALSDGIVDARFAALLDTLSRLPVPDEFDPDEPPALPAPLEDAAE